MRISTKGRYALRIMLDLAKHENEGFIRLKDIAARQNVTVKYMEQIMPLLTKAGYVKSFRGNNGGYKLAYEPEEYKVGQILRVAEGQMAPIPCLEDSPNRCPRKEECVTLPFWQGMWDVINEYADSKTLADLLEEEK